ncbi:MAG TPA: P-type conjugative transfer protein TrbG [Sphingobium sp.]|uniref:P-type conjugative transfer protein TrbG n=1 Tax=Sphingobium sp. TaxID=1912891 RepID=UPI002ED2DCF3
MKYIPSSLTIIGLALAQPSHAELPRPLGVVGTADRLATIQPTPQGFINAVQVYVWSDGALYQGYTAPGTVTDIELQPGEKLLAVASGDTARWTIGDTTSGSGDTQRTHVLVKPFAAGLSTNLVITTDRRSYHVRLASTSGSAMVALRWTYPQDDMVKVKMAAAAAEAAAPVASGMAVEQLHFNYAISGDAPVWRPLRAFDDSRQTFIEFPETIGVGEAPPLFTTGADGKPELVNYRMRGHFYVVDRIFDAAELRLGLKKQQVVRIARVADKGRAR